MVDGWLMYDFRRNNEFTHRELKIPENRKCTRRFFYWRPNVGEPVKIVHAIEPHVLEGIAGREVRYDSQAGLVSALRETLKGARCVAMEVSSIPYLSRVDAGTVDLVRSLGIAVESSAPLLSRPLTARQVETGRIAAASLDRIAGYVWDSVRVGMNEGEVVAMMLRAFEQEGLITDHPPCCAVDANSANPHYEPPPMGGAQIREGSLVLIDLWGKLREPDAIFGDITRVAVMGHPTDEMLNVFGVVRKAQVSATQCVREQVRRGVTGAEVDRVARSVVEQAGYGKFLMHRTGHSIDQQLHGNGTHLDSVECPDDRKLVFSSCCSVEPGIYLPGRFGIRLEYDLYVGPDGAVEVWGGEEPEIRRLLGRV